MKKRPKVVWAIRPDLSEGRCPDCGANAVYAYGILTDEEYKRRRCRPEAGGCGHEFIVEDA